MGRKKINIETIKDDRLRNVKLVGEQCVQLVPVCITFNKRKSGLLKKAAELSMLCNIHVCLAFTDVYGNMINFYSPDSNIVLDIQKTHPYKKVYTFTRDDYPNFFGMRIKKRNSNVKKEDQDSHSLDQIEESDGLGDEEDEEGVEEEEEYSSQNSKPSDIHSAKKNHENKANTPTPGTPASKIKPQLKKILKIQVPENNMIKQNMSFLKLIGGFQPQQKVQNNLYNLHTVDTFNQANHTINAMLEPTNNQNIVIPQLNTNEPSKNSHQENPENGLSQKAVPPIAISNSPQTFNGKQSNQQSALIGDFVQFNDSQQTKISLIKQPFQNTMQQVNYPQSNLSSRDAYQQNSVQRANNSKQRVISDDTLTDHNGNISNIEQPMRRDSVSNIINSQSNNKKSQLIPKVEIENDNLIQGHSQKNTLDANDIQSEDLFQFKQPKLDFYSNTIGKSHQLPQITDASINQQNKNQINSRLQNSMQKEEPNFQMSNILPNQMQNFNQNQIPNQPNHLFKPSAGNIMQMPFQNGSRISNPSSLSINNQLPFKSGYQNCNAFPEDLFIDSNQVNKNNNFYQMIISPDQPISPFQLQTNFFKSGINSNGHFGLIDSRSKTPYQQSSQPNNLWSQSPDKSFFNFKDHQFTSELTNLDKIKSILPSNHIFSQSRYYPDSLGMCKTAYLDLNGNPDQLFFDDNSFYSQQYNHNNLIQKQLEIPYLDQEFLGKGISNLSSHYLSPNTQQYSLQQTSIPNQSNQNNVLPQNNSEQHPLTEQNPLPEQQFQTSQAKVNNFVTQKNQNSLYLNDKQ